VGVVDQDRERLALVERLEAARRRGDTGQRDGDLLEVTPSA